MTVFYTQLARWWPLISPVDGYREEATEVARVLVEALPETARVLELGSGGGHNAFHLKRQFAMTLSDLSHDMLEVSRRLNPECEHVAGDMRTLDLGREFDAVFVHDAVDYMTTEADLAAAIATAHRHCRPGGVVLFVPDAVTETFEPGTDCGGSDGPGGEAIRYLEWSYDLDPSDAQATVQYTFVVREVDGSVASYRDEHVVGLFTRATWTRLLEERGFAVEVVTERTTEDHAPRLLFLGRRP